jgi:FtsP/CotA-like multicopper oxidase with cupredoxin domain
VYHCAVAPIPLHISHGMYGLLYVEPEGGLPIVDREYAVMQSEFYVDPPEKGTNLATTAYDLGLKEEAQVCVFNGREGALTDKPLKASVGDRVRLFVGNAGPNLSSAFHVIGGVFDALYREGDVISPPARGIQTTTIPPGGAAIVEINAKVPGTLTLVDHALYRLDKGCVGFLQVVGDPQPDLYHSSDGPSYCVGCKIHS